MSGSIPTHLISDFQIINMIINNEYDVSVSANGIHSFRFYLYDNMLIKFSDYIFYQRMFDPQHNVNVSPSMRHYFKTNFSYRDHVVVKYQLIQNF